MDKVCFGVDVGGTTVKLGLFDEKGSLLDKWEITTRKENLGAYVLNDIAESIFLKIKEKNIDREKVIGVGLGVPGPVKEDGTVSKVVNIGWENINPGLILKSLTGFKAKIANDANTAALGEMWQGGGLGYENLLMITLGTGIGGGVIIDGKIVTGKRGLAGEIGHMFLVYDEKEPCECGNIGCLEQVSSASGIVKEAKKRLRDSNIPSILRGIEVLTAKDVIDGARLKDSISLETIENMGKYLGIALSHMAVVIDPEIIVIGGGVSKAGDFILEVIKRNYRKYAFLDAKDIEFSLARLGNDAGIYGAAKLILEDDM